MYQAIADIESLHADATVSLKQQVHREKALHAGFNADRGHLEGLTQAALPVRHPQGDPGRTS